MRNAMLIVLFWALPALAGEVYLNDVNVTGLKNQTFEKARVRIDDRGDVHIDAPGYKVEKVQVGRGAPPAEATMTRKYVLITEQAVPGMAEYDIELFINGRFVQTFKSADRQIYTEVTRYLHAGSNTVTLQARKRYANPNAPRSHSKDHFFRVIIGEGEMGSDMIVVEKPLITFERTAADVADVAQEFTLTTR